MENNVFIEKLVGQNLLTEEVGQKLLQEASFAKRNVEEFIHERKLVPEDKLLEIKSGLLQVPYKQVDVSEIPEAVMKRVPEETVRNFRVVPLSEQDGMLVVGMVHPDDERAKEALRFIAQQQKVNLGVYLISFSLWEEVLRKYSPFRGEVQKAVSSITSLESSKRRAKQQFTQLEVAGGTGGAEEAPVIKIVASTLKEAVFDKASDIHIEPQRNRLRIRFRIDGELHEVASMPVELHQPIVSRVKVLSDLKIDETRIPQDGRFRTLLMGRDIDFRVATFPTPVGEKVAIRVLDPTVGLKGLEELGLMGKNLDLIKQEIRRPYGMVLITGPTGSGKTTTLYALMQLLNKDEVNVVSLEDPVEYYMDGLNQSQVRPEIGYNFASGLRQILRQDPDVIMVGEIRDDETAELSVHAALTGHIVLSTLHTNNAVGVIPRLVDMGVEPFLLPAALNLMVAQRLLPRLCQKCLKEKEITPQIKSVIEKELALVSDEDKKALEISAPYKVYESEGCDACNGKGVVGRVAIFEMLQMTRELSKIVSSRPSENDIIEEAKRQHMFTLRQDGIAKALKGLISIEAVMRETREL